MNTFKDKYTVYHKFLNWARKSMLVAIKVFLLYTVVELIKLTSFFVVEAKQEFQNKFNFCF